MSTLIDRFGSAWVEVTIESPDDSDDFLLKRRPGPSGPSRFPVVWHGKPVIANGVELVWPEVEEEILTYRVGGPSSASRWLLSPDIEFRRTALDTVARCIDVVTKLSRDAQSTPLLTALPAPLRRLSTHLENPATSAVLRWRAALKDAVDGSAVVGLLDLLATHHHDDATFAHGGLSIGGIIPVTTGVYDGVLTGEDAGSASAGHDIGWIVGELLEMRAAAHDTEDDDGGALLDEAIQDILRKHAGHPQGTHRAAALRIALHAEDYAHHIGWDDGLIRHAQLLAKVWADDAWISTGEFQPLDRSTL